MPTPQDFSFEPEKKHDPSCQKNATPPTCPLAPALMDHYIKLLTPRPFRKRHPILFWGSILLILFAIVVAIIPNDMYPEAEDRLAVVRIEGIIMDTTEHLEWIETLVHDNSVKGVLLRINSPGGGAAAAQELYEALAGLGKTKPIIASMGSTAASGGLMVAMAAHHIVANPSSVTGSIGVRMDIPQLQNLLAKLGVGQETLKIGKFKDAGSMTRPMNEEERAYLSKVLQDMHDQFVDLIATARKLPKEKVTAVADGRIFTGKEAQSLGLVDSLGGQDSALQHLRALTNIPATVPLYEQEEPMKLWKELANTLLNVQLPPVEQGPIFLF